MPPPVAGVPFDLETAAGRVTGYRLGEGRTVLLLHSFNAAGSGIELAPLATRLAEHRRVVLVDWLGFGTSDRPDAPYGWELYGEQLERIRMAALQPGETSVDVVALSLPAQYVVVAAAEHPQRFGRIVLISPTGFGRFKGDAGRTSRNIYRFLRLTGIGRLLFAVLARRQVIRWFLRQTFADPGRSRGSTSGTAGGPASSRAPSELRWRSCPGCSMTRGRRAPTSGSRTRRSSSSGTIRASPTPRPPRRSSPRTAPSSGSRSSTPGICPSWSNRTKPRP